MRYKYISVLLVFLLFFGKVEHVLGQDDSPEIIGHCRVELELKPGQGCATPDGGTFSIQTDGCVRVRSADGGSTTKWQRNASTRCENGEYVANRISTNPLTWRIDSDSVPHEQEIIGDCRAGLELKPGQGCSVPDKGFFSVRADGCVGDTPLVSGRTEISDMSLGGGSMCVKGKWRRGDFAASRFSSDPLKWRIDSVTPGQAN